VEVTAESRTVRFAGQQLAPTGHPPHPSPLPQGGRGEKKAVVSFVGAGNYATAVLVPAFKKAGAGLRSIASSGGVSGVHAGRKYGFEETTTDTDRLFVDGEAHAVVITTRHDSHARFVLQALGAGKHVFVEKPLCLTMAKLGEIEGVVRRDFVDSLTPALYSGHPALRPYGWPSGGSNPLPADLSPGERGRGGVGKRLRRPVLTPTLALPLPGGGDCWGNPARGQGRRRGASRRGGRSQWGDAAADVDGGFQPAVFTAGAEDEGVIGGRCRP